MATKPILSREVYLALAAVGWADGELTPEAADAIVRTALEEGLPVDEVAAIEQATRQKIDMVSLDRMDMTKADRLYVYAVASWIAQLDGSMSRRGREALAVLAQSLGIPEAPRHHADEIMHEVAARSDRPERFDLLALRRTLDDRLEQARAARIGKLMREGN
jgi:uncharacterized membrane protein YebE (DUF533 family)